MIARSHGQRNLFETVIGPLEKLVEGLVEPALERLDQLLADEQLVEAVAVQMAKRRPRSRTHGRPGTPVEVALRMLVLKRLRGWSFEETERKVRASLVYRQLVRVYFEKVPDAKMLLRLSGGDWQRRGRGNSRPAPRDRARAKADRGSARAGRYDGSRDRHSLSHRFPAVGRRGAGAGAGA
jgi:hypothetical protein